MAGLTTEGLSIKRLQDIRDEITARLQGFFGTDINTSEDAVFGQIRDSIAPGESSIWEQLQIVYDSQFPSRAEGQQLDDNVAIVGVFRLGDQNTTVTASVTGDNGVVIPVGFTVAVDTTGDEFEIVDADTLSNTKSTETLISVDTITNNTLYTVTVNNQAATYTSDGDATVAEIVAGLIAAIPVAEPLVTAVGTGNPEEILISSVDPLNPLIVTVDTNISISKVTNLIEMESVEAGPIPAPINQLTDIKTFISGIDTVTNKEVGTLGRIRETDAELRARRDLELGLSGSTSLNAIFTRVSTLPDVRTTVILENFTDSIDGNNLKPHSFQVIVDGGDDDDIAQAIFDSKPIGIDMNGAVAVNVVDSVGTSQEILFDRPTIIPIYIEVTLTKFLDYPSNGDDLIKAALVQYGVDNLFAGDDVIQSRLYSPVNTIQGHQIDSLFIGTSPSPTLTDPITIDLTELALISTANITIVTT